MEFEGRASGGRTAVFQALEAVEPSQAAEALSTLTDALHGKGPDSLDLDLAFEAFKHLLDRRGYYVATPAQLAASLAEIKAVGPGFDLYELACSLASYDAVRTKCRKLSQSRSLPELHAFAPDCSCIHPRKEK